MSKRICPCARVNGVRKYSVPKYCLFASTTCQQCLQLAGRVYLWCTVSRNYTQVNVCVHSVYKLCKVFANYAQCLHVCTVSTDYTPVNVYVHSVCKLCTVSTCIQGVYRLYVYTRIHVYVYANMHVYVHIC